MKRRLLVQLLDSAQDFQLVFDREPVAGLGLNGCRPRAQKPFTVAPARQNQLFMCRKACAPDRRLDAAAARSDLLVSRTTGALLVLVCARACEHRMRVRV